MAELIVKSADGGAEIRAALALLLVNQDFRNLMNEAAEGAFQEETDSYLRDLRAEFTARGPDGLPLDKLAALLNEARERRDTVAFNTLARHLLHVVAPDPRRPGDHSGIAEEVLRTPSNGPSDDLAHVHAHCYLAKQKFFAYSAARARHFISCKSIEEVSGKFSVDAMRDAARNLLTLRLDYYTHILNALRLSPKSEIKEAFALTIITFLFTYELDTMFLKKADVPSSPKVKAEILEMYENLDTMAKSGLFHATAAAEFANNRATFHYLDEDFANAKKYAATARDGFLKAGLAHAARIAQETFSEADTEKPPIDPNEDPFSNTTMKDVFTFMEENARRILALKGIDVENDPHLQAEIRRGIKNSDPSQIYRHCESVVVGSDGASPLAEEIRLIGMGDVLITCRKYGLQVRDREIDEAFLKFKSRVCLGCKVRNPRPDSWEYTPQFEMEMHSDQFSDVAGSRPNKWCAVNTT